MISRCSTTSGVFEQLVVYGSADVGILAVKIVLVAVYARMRSPAHYGALTTLC